MADFVQALGEQVASLTNPAVVDKVEVYALNGQ